MKVKVLNKQPNSKMCFVCGLKNKMGLKARFYELENNQLLGVFRPAEEHQGYPGRLHGGIAATILDETIGRAITIVEENIWGVTIDFSIKYRKPVTLGKEIHVLAKIGKNGKRSFKGSGTIFTENGEVAVEGNGRYLKMDLEKISDFDHQEQEWRAIEEAQDPEYFELVENMME